MTGLPSVVLIVAAAAAADSVAPDASPPLHPYTAVHVAMLAGHGDGRGEVIEPAGIAVDAFGRLVVTDAALHRIQRIAPDGRWVGEAGVLGSRPGELRRPGDAALLGALGVAVLDRENRRVVSYDLFGRFLGIVVDLRSDVLRDEVGRIDPVAIATDRGGALYVADSDQDRILAFDFAGTYLYTVGGFGARAGSFRGLSGLAVTPKGELVAAERGNRRIQRLDAGGRPVVSWAIAVDSTPGPLALAVDDSLRIAMVDTHAGELRVFDASGRLLAVHAGLDAPAAVAFAPDGTLLVADRGRVQRFRLEPRRGAPRRTEP